MDSGNRNRNRYDRVMSRVHNSTRCSLKSSSYVTRHDNPSSVKVGAKQSVSNISSRVFSELPTVLNDYVPESTRVKSRRNVVVKPRKTIKSLDPALSPRRTVIKENKFNNIRGQQSAPAVLASNGEKWSNSHLRECMSSRSHSRLKDLKDEINSYKETERLLRLRSSLYKKCGVVLDDAGNMVEDKAVQVEPLETKPHETGQVISGFQVDDKKKGANDELAKGQRWLASIRYLLWDQTMEIRDQHFIELREPKCME